MRCIMRIASARRSRTDTLMVRDGAGGGEGEGRGGGSGGEKAGGGGGGQGGRTGGGGGQEEGGGGAISAAQNLCAPRSQCTQGSAPKSGMALAAL